MKKRFSAVLTSALIVSALFSGCAAEKENNAVGHIVLSVNPEIRISYDKYGNVTDIDGINKDGDEIVNNYDNYIGRNCRIVVTELVEEIHEAGYLVEEIDGEKKRIVIELETGSAIPDDDFLDDIGDDLEDVVANLDLTPSVVIEEDDGITDYATENITIEIPVTTTAPVETTAKPTPSGKTDYGTTDYGNTNYGTTDYGATDYDVTTTAKPTPSGKTDYGTTDYGNTNYGTTDYGATDYDVTTTAKPTSSGNIAGGNSDYGTTNYGNTNYGATNYTPAPVVTTAAPVRPPVTNGNSGYGNSNYGNSNYGRNSNYGNSGYDD